MDIRKLLTPFWISYPEDRHFPRGQGVSAFTEEDAFFLLDEYGYDYHRRATRVDVRVIESVDELDANHVVSNMGPISFRGIWYPCLNIGIAASGCLTRPSFEHRIVQAEVALSARGEGQDRNRAMNDKRLLGTHKLIYDDSHLAEETAQSRERAQSLGLDECCRRLFSSGLNKQESWRWIRFHFDDVTFATFSRAFDVLGADGHSED